MTDSPDQTPWPVQLLKAFAWPAVAMFILVSFWTPLQKVASMIPETFDKLDTVSIGGVQVHVSSGLSQQAPPAVKQTLAKLSPAAIQYIVENDIGGPARTTAPVLRVEENELIEVGLCTPLTEKKLLLLAKEDRKEESNPAEYKAGFECGLTYADARRFLMELIPELVRQATSGHTTKKAAQPKK
jgi:hypothetical protein